MMRKGQKSLEMIIGLVILLVVAGVVISTFLNQFQSNPASQYEDTLKKEEVKNTCSQLCGTYKDATGNNALTAAIEYCTRTFRMDVDGDGSTSEVAGSLYNSYCEDGVHCFNQHTCEVGYNKLDAAECKQLMCEYYETVEKIPSSNASERIRRRYVPSGEKDRTIGTCGLPKVESTTGQPIKTWYSENFQGSNICDYSNPTSSGPSPTSGSWCEDSANSGTSGAVTITNPSGDQCITGAQNAEVTNHYSGTTGELEQASDLPGSSPCGSTGVLYCDMDGASGKDPSAISW